MANWILGFLYPRILFLPLEFLAEEFLKQEFPNLFHFRIDAYYDLRTEWRSSFEQRQEKPLFEGWEFIAPYVIYMELLKIRHFKRIINKDDSENLSRFKEVYQERKRLLNNSCNEELLRYFNEKEDELTIVSSSPLYFHERGFLDLSNRLWELPSTS